MSLSEGLKLVNITTVVAGVVTIFCTFAPGSLVIYQFNQRLYLELDAMKLLLLSAAITLPSIFAPYLATAVGVCGQSFTKEKLLGIDHFAMLVNHGLNAGLNIYTTLAICYFAELSFKTFLAIYIILIIVACIV